MKGNKKKNVDSKRLHDASVFMNDIARRSPLAKLEIKLLHNFLTFYDQKWWTSVYSRRVHFNAVAIDFVCRVMR